MTVNIVSSMDPGLASCFFLFFCGGVSLDGDSWPECYSTLISVHLLLDYVCLPVVSISRNGAQRNGTKV